MTRSVADLVAFIRARLDEAEAEARKDLVMLDRASGDGQWVTRYGYNRASILTVDDAEVCRLVATRDLRHPNGLPVDGDDEDQHTQDAALVGRLVRAARGRAERTIRDVEVKWQIVDLHAGEHECVGDRHGRVETVLVAPGYAHEVCPTLLALAGVWSDHPDFRAEWRP